MHCMLPVAFINRCIIDASYKHSIKDTLFFQDETPTHSKIYILYLLRNHYDNHFFPEEFPEKHWGNIWFVHFVALSVNVCYLNTYENCVFFLRHSCLFSNKSCDENNFKLLKFEKHICLFFKYILFSKVIHHVLIFSYTKFR